MNSQPPSASRLASLLSTLRQPRGAFATLGLGVLLIFGYLIMVNDTATLGLSTAKVQQDLKKLQAETKQLEIELANVQSFATLERTGRSLELTIQATPEFVVPSGSVAVR